MTREPTSHAVIVSEGSKTLWGGRTVKVTHVCTECGVKRDTPCPYLGCPLRRAA